MASAEFMPQIHADLIYGALGDPVVAYVLITHSAFSLDPIG